MKGQDVELTERKKWLSEEEKGSEKEDVEEKNVLGSSKVGQKDASVFGTVVYSAIILLATACVAYVIYGFADDSLPMADSPVFVPVGIGMIYLCIAVTYASFIGLSDLYDDHSALSDLFFLFVAPVFSKLLSGGVSISRADIPKCPKADDPEIHANRMREYLKSYRAFWAYVAFIWPSMRNGLLLSALGMSAAFVQPIANRQVVRYLQDISSGENPSKSEGYAWAILGGGVLVFFTSLFSQHSLIWGKFAARRAYAALCTLTFEKPSKVTARKLGHIEEGKILNMMSVDCLSVANVTMFLQFASTAIIMIVASVIQIIYELGLVALPAVILIVCLSIVNKKIGDKAKILTMMKNKVSDKRNVKLNETLSGMRTVKLYAWESMVERKVDKIRRGEEAHLITLAWWNALLSFITQALPQIAVAGTLLLYVQVEGDLEPDKAFFVVNLFIYLNFGVIILPMITVMWGMIRSNLDRLEILLKLDNDFVPPKSVGASGQVDICAASFSWGSSSAAKRLRERSDSSASSSSLPPAVKAGDDDDQELETYVLKDVTMSIEPGSLVAVVGAVSSGKTTLCNGILSLLPCSGGDVKVGGTTAYVAQKSFIFNDTVKKNILFHADESTFDKAAYEASIHCAALEPDLKVLQRGDLTEIGERGVTISGGQRQRISCARAAYRQADVTVFDDPLSAMDAHVGSVVFERLIKKHLKDKTRILFTNQLHFCKECDRIFVLKDGRVSESGAFDELMSKRGDFYEMIADSTSKHPGSKNDGNNEDENEEVLVATKTSSVESKDDAKNDDDMDAKTTATSSHDAKTTKESTPKSLMRREHKTSSRPSPLFMLSMAKSADGLWLLAAAAFMFVATPTVEWTANFMLAKWISDGDQGDLPSYAIYYVCVAFLFAILASLSAPIYQYFFLKCSTLLHHQMLRSVLSQSMQWFDTTPVGRILNRFAGDVMDLDLTLPRIFNWWQRTVSTLFVALIPAIVIVPECTPFVVFMCVVCVVVYRLYGNVNIEIARLYMMSVGPILSSFTGYMSGLDTIRAFDRVDAFRGDFSKAVMAFMDISYWQAAIDAMSQFYVGGAVASLLFLLPLSIFLIYDETSPELAALLLMYGASFSMRLPRGLFMTVQVEKSMVAAQRLVEYIKLEPETALRGEKSLHRNKKSSAATRPSSLSSSALSSRKKAWAPKAGALTFSNVSARYRSDLPLVLDNVNVTFPAGSKVGIVGRTGSGKSTLVLTAFRMLELDRGSIKIDGRNICDIPVRELRGGLGMIPQDTHMYRGTMRSNLDVEGDIYSDAEIWNALARVHLKEVVSAFPKKLDHGVLEKGSNLSAGTVQLVCLARVLLKRPKLLFLDEATASVDLQTDRRVQETIRNAFPGSTIVTIAHRLNTVIDYDYILTMDGGKVAEWGPPGELLAKQPAGIFSQLVDATGEGSSKKLREIAASALAKKPTRGA